LLGDKIGVKKVSKEKITIIDDNRYLYWGWIRINGVWTNTILGYTGLYLVKDGKIYKVRFKQVVRNEKVDHKCVMTKWTFYNRVYECDSDLLKVIERSAESMEYIPPEYTNLYSLITK